MKVHGYVASPRVQRVLITALYAEIDLTLIEFNPYTASEEAKKEYRKTNPNGKVPTLETPEGNIYES